MILPWYEAGSTQLGSVKASWRKLPIAAGWPCVVPAVGPSAW